MADLSASMEAGAAGTLTPTRKTSFDQPETPAASSSSSTAINLSLSNDSPSATNAINAVSSAQAKQTQAQIDALDDLGSHEESQIEIVNDGRHANLFVNGDNQVDSLRVHVGFIGFVEEPNSVYYSQFVGVMSDERNKFYEMQPYSTIGKLKQAILKKDPRPNYELVLYNKNVLDVRQLLHRCGQRDQYPTITEGFRDIDDRYLPVDPEYMANEIAKPLDSKFGRLRNLVYLNSLTSNSELYLTALIKPVPSELSLNGLQRLLPNIHAAGIADLLEQLQQIPRRLINLNSIRETKLSTEPTPVTSIVIKNLTTGKTVDHIIVDDDQFYPVESNSNSNTVKFYSRYIGHYQAANEQILSSVKMARQTYSDSVEELRVKLETLSKRRKAIQSELERIMNLFATRKHELQPSDYPKFLQLSLDRSNIDADIQQSIVQLSKLEPPSSSKILTASKEPKFTEYQFRPEIQLEVGDIYESTSNGYFRSSHIQYEIIKLKPKTQRTIQLSGANVKLVPVVSSVK